MKKSKHVIPLYMKTKEGDLIPLEPENDRPITFADEAAALICESICPELVITEEELEKAGKRQAKENYNKLYKPAIEALKKYGPLSPEKVSEITGRSVKEENKYLERLWKAGLIEKEGNVYSITDENLITNFFNVRLV